MNKRQAKKNKKYNELNNYLNNVFVFENYKKDWTIVRKRLYCLMLNSNKKKDYNNKKRIRNLKNHEDFLKTFSSF